MKKYWVYIHTCPNGKRYVGATTRIKPKYRWGKNGEGYRGQLFEEAIRKYGWNNITHEVFEVDSKEEMYRKEVELISFYHSNDPEFGYNLSSGGEKSALGCIRSEEYRKKRSEAQKKRCNDPEYRKKLSEARKGKPHSEEHKRHIAEAKKGKPFSEEHRKHLAEAIKKRRLDPEFGKKMSESTKEKWTDPEYRRKQFEAHKGQIRSEETKRRISEAKKGTHLSEETKRRMSEAKKGKPKPKVKIKLPDGTIVEMPKNLLARNYINKGRKFEYVS